MNNAIEILIVITSIASTLVILLLIGNSLLKKVLYSTNNLKNEDLKTVNVKNPRLKKITKRFFDIVLSSFIIIFILSWLIPIIGLAIRLNSKGPVFFKQRRIGKNGIFYYAIKFRTYKTIPSSEKILHNYPMKNDRRITKVGDFLRKTSLDEFPNVLNVFTGNISMVGRSHILDFPQFTPKIEKKILDHLNEIKPGLISLYDITKASYLFDPSDMVKYDLYYINHQSLSLDISIILGSIVKIIGGTTLF